MSNIRSRSIPVFVGATLALLALVSPAVSGVPAPSNYNWTLAIAGGPPVRCYGATTVYDQVADKLILFGGNNCSSGKMNDTWVLSNASGAGGAPSWAPLVTTGLPPARDNHTAVYDAATDRMIIFGGCLGGCSPTTNDTWVLTNASGVGGPSVWSPVATTGGPPSPRQGARAAYDPNTNRMIIWTGQNGGCCLGGGALSFEVWVLTNANGLGGPAVWSLLVPVTPPPPGAYYGAMTYNPGSNVMTVFGGGDVNGTITNATWSLFNANGLGGSPLWINTRPEGEPGAPAGTVANGFTGDPAHARFMIFGGANLDTWVQSFADTIGSTPLWTQLTTGGNPPPGTGVESVTYDPTTNQLIAFTLDPTSTANPVYRLSNGNGIVAAPPPPPPAVVRAAAKSRFAKEPINIKTKGRTPMTVFGSASFDVTQIDDATVAFGANGTESHAVAAFTQTVKVDKDLFLDRVFYFQKSPLATPCGTTLVKIKGTLISGQQFSGQDAIKIVPCP